MGEWLLPGAGGAGSYSSIPPTMTGPVKAVPSGRPAAGLDRPSPVPRTSARRPMQFAGAVLQGTHPTEFTSGPSLGLLEPSDRMDRYEVLEPGDTATTFEADRAEPVRRGHNSAGPSFDFRPSMADTRVKEQRQRNLIAGSIWGRYFEVLPLPKGGGDYDVVWCLRAIGIIKDNPSGGSRLVVRVTAAPIVTIGFPGFAVLSTAAGIVALTTLDVWSAVIFGFCLLFLAVASIVCVACNKWSAEQEILATWSSALKERLDSLPPRV